MTGFYRGWFDSLSPSEQLLAAARVTIQCFSRANLNEDNYLGDDEHEAWSLLQTAVNAVEKEAAR